jgi:Holliday junction resolvase
MDPKKSQLRRSQRQERRIASRNGASSNAGSGNTWTRKNDSRNERFLFEQKRTDNTKSISVTEKEIRDLRNHAAQIGREPVLTIELNGRHYYVIEEPLWEELTGDDRP